MSTISIHNLLINCPQFVLTWNANPQFVKRPQFVLLVSTIFRKRLHILWTFHNLCVYQCNFGPKTSLKYPKNSPAVLKNPFEYIHRGSKIQNFSRLRRARQSISTFKYQTARSPKKIRACGALNQTISLCYSTECPPFLPALQRARRRLD